MPGTTVRVSEAVHDRLHKLAAEKRMTMSAVLDSALAEYERKLFWAKTAAEFQSLRNDPKAWKAELEEREAWDATLADGRE
jgi:predicted transcriptional regulator